MDHKFSKIVFFSKQYTILEIRKCYSMAMVLTFDIPQIVSPGTYVLKLKKSIFFSLQNSLNCKAENPLKANISVEKFNECLIK